MGDQCQIKTNNLTQQNYTVTSLKSIILANKCKLRLCFSMKTYEICENYVSNTEFIEPRTPMPMTRKCTCNNENEQLVISARKQLVSSSDYYSLNDLNMKRGTIRFGFRVFPQHISSFFIKIDSLKFILNDTNILMEDLNSSYMMKEETNRLTTSHGLLHSDFMSEQTIWVSFDENFVKFGHGFVMRENLLFTFTNLTRNVTIENIKIDSSVVFIQPYVYLSSTSITQTNKSPFIKSDELTNADKEQGVMMPDSLPKQAQSVFFHLNGFNFDQYDAQSIHFSLNSKGCTLNEKFVSSPSSNFL